MRCPRLPVFFFRGRRLFDGDMLVQRADKNCECMMHKQSKVMAGAVNLSMQEEVEATAKLEQICFAVP